MVSNPGYYSQMATAGSLTQIEDGVDNPHTGLIKALSLGVAGNYVISGFDATSVNATGATIAAGVVLRDGKKVAISGSSVSLSATYTTGYHLLVARSSALAVINPAAANKVPAFTAGDVPIAILAHTGSNPMQIQYFGTGKTENSLSVAYDSSGYTEMGTVTSDADSIDIATTNSNADINLTPHGTGDVKLGTLAIDGDQTVGAGQDGHALIYTHSNAKAALAALPATYSDSDAVSAVEAESTLVLQSGVTVGTDLKLSTSSDNVVIENVTQDKDIIFQIDDGGVDTEVMRIDGSTSRIGIGTTTPDAKLHIEGDANDEVVLHITTTGGTSGSVQGKAHIGMSHFNSDTVPSATITVEEIDVSDHRANMSFSTRASGSSNAAPTEKMRITHDGKVGIGDTSPSTTLSVNGDVSGDKFLVESIQYELASDFTSAGAIPGPASAPSLTLTDTDSIYRITTSVGNPPGTAALDVVFPATSGNEGLVLKIIFPAIAGAPDDLLLKSSGSDNIIAPDNSVLAASGGSHTLTTAGVYEAICISGSWIFYKIS